MTRAPFQKNTGRRQEYQNGYRAAVKDAITWLHVRATEMNDQKAIDVLNSAAFSMGVDGAEWSSEVPALDRLLLQGMIDKHGRG